MQSHLRLVSLPLFLLFSLLIATDAMAKKDGITGYSGRFGATCGACHAPGPSNGLPPPPVVAPLPTVTLTGPTQVSAGTTNTYQVTMSGGVVPDGDGGLNLSVTAGQLVATTSNTQILNNELTHKPTPPFNNPTFVDSAGRITWTFDWQAPSVNGTETMYVTVLSGNGDYGFYGDRVGATTLAINVLGGAAQAPVARPGGPYTGVVGTSVALNGNTSSDGDGSVVSYSWDFGDGTIGIGATSGHVYIAAGLYTVTLTVTDNSGLTGSATTTVNIGTSTPPPPVIDGLALYDVQCSACHGAAPGTKAGRSAAAISNAITNVPAMNSPALLALSAAQVQAISNAIAPVGPQPPVAVSGGPYSGVAGTAVLFNGAGSSDPDGSLVAYSWDFGDGAIGVGVAPNHVYAVAGLYTATLTVTDNSGLTGSATTTVNIGTSTPPPPVIDGLALYNSNCAACHGAAPGTKANRTAAQIQNAITNVGAMQTAALFALSAAQVQAIANAIQTSGPAPQPPVSVPGGPYTGLINAPVAFNGGGSYDPDGLVMAYSWSFGDGTSATGATPTHAYAAVGLYTVTLTVTDNGGLTTAASTTANIGTGTPPPPVIDGLALYNANCAGCHGAAPGTKAGRTAAQIQNAIVTVNAMITPALQALTTAQLQAIADAIGGGTPPPTPTDGKGLYDSYCASCHGAGGSGGSGGNVQRESASSILEAINKEQEMAFLKGSLSSTQISLIAGYLSGSTGGGGTPTIPVGQLLYDSNCIACHGAGGRGGSGGGVRGSSSSKILDAINKEREMSFLRGAFTSQQIRYISDYLNGRSTPLVPAPSSTDGLALYGAYCSGCHGTAPGTKAGRSSTQISGAISSVSAMNTPTLTGLSAAQIDAIAAAIGGSTGGGGTPPPSGSDGLALYGTNCASCHGAAPGTKANRTSAQISLAITSVNAMNTSSLRALTTAQIDAIAAAISTGGAPPPLPTTGQGLYDLACLSCHGVRGGGGSGGNIRGDSASSIQDAIRRESQMRYLDGVYTLDQLRKIASYIAR